jgi:diguanylate cyclase (GGDEF)-like protein
MAKQSALDLGSTGVKTDAQPPDPATVQKALTQLEQAIRDHAEWHENLLRAVVCASSFDLNDLTEGAHFQCRFGRWYYEQAVDEVRRQPSFAVIGREHEHQHRIAAKLLRDVVADAPIVREDFEELVAAGTRLRLELDSLRSEVQASLLARDSLTGAFSRAEMLPELRGWREQAMRGVQKCCIVFMDLDHFKEINDTYGHQVGDEVLAGAVRYLGQCLRPYDKVFRYGGDEFLISLPGADLELGQAVVKRVREGLARRPLVADAGGLVIHATASFGLALLDPDVSVEESIERADQALLLAKTAGRNRAIKWDAAVTTSTRLPRLKLEDFPGGQSG